MSAPINTHYRTNNIGCSSSPTKLIQDFKVKLCSEKNFIHVIDEYERLINDQRDSHQAIYEALQALDPYSLLWWGYDRNDIVSSLITSDIEVSIKKTSSESSRRIQLFLISSFLDISQAKAAFQILEKMEAEFARPENKNLLIKCFQFFHNEENFEVARRIIYGIVDNNYKEEMSFEYVTALLRTYNKKQISPSFIKKDPIVISINNPNWQYLIDEWKKACMDQFDDNFFVGGY